MRRFAFALIGLSLVAATATGQVCEIERLSNVATPGSVSHPLILSGVAYIAGDSAGIVRVDVSDPSGMFLIGSDPSDGPGHDLSLDYFRNLLVTAPTPSIEPAPIKSRSPTSARPSSRSPVPARPSSWSGPVRAA